MIVKTTLQEQADEMSIWRWQEKDLSKPWITSFFLLLLFFFKGTC